MGCTSLAQLVFLSSSIPRICSRLLCTTQAWTHTCGTEPLTQSSHCVCELPEGDRTDLPSSALPSSWAAFVRGELLTNTTGGNSYGNTSKRRCYCIPIRLKEEKNEEGKKMFGHQCHVDIQSRHSEQGKHPLEAPPDNQQTLGKAAGLRVLQTPHHCYQVLSCELLFSIPVQPQLKVPA